MAKVANHIAKKNPSTQGVFVLDNPSKLESILSNFDIADIWGIGRRLSKRLNDVDIFTAQDLAIAHAPTLRKQFSVVMEKMIYELNGIPCFHLEESPAPKKQIMCSRSFGKPITDITVVHQAVSNHVASALEKLRKAKQYCQVLTVFIRTSPFSKNAYYAKAATAQLPQPTHDTRELLHVAHVLLEKIWRPNYQYAKAGILLDHLSHERIEQFDLFYQEKTEAELQRSDALMKVIDQINQRQKKKIVRFASQGIDKSWTMRRERLSPKYTTSWKEIPVVQTQALNNKHSKENLKV
ncbi:MAG: DUF4113 domain-containing protein [Pseudomonadota bacterium]